MSTAARGKTSWTPPPPSTVWLTTQASRALMYSRHADPRRSPSLGATLILHMSQQCLSRRRALHFISTARHADKVSPAFSSWWLWPPASARIIGTIRGTATRNAKCINIRRAGAYSYCWNLSIATSPTRAAHLYACAEVWSARLWEWLMGCGARFRMRAWVGFGGLIVCRWFSEGVWIFGGIFMGQVNVSGQSVGGGLGYVVYWLLGKMEPRVVGSWSIMKSWDFVDYNDLVRENEKGFHGVNRWITNVKRWVPLVWKFFIRWDEI